MILSKFKAGDITIDQYKAEIGDIPQQIKNLQAELDAELSIDDEGDEVINEYETHYERINGTCYRINDEGDRQKVADHYCR